MTDTRALRRPGAAGDDVPRALRHREGLRRLSPAPRAAGHRARRRSRARTTKCSATSARGSALERRRRRPGRGRCADGDRGRGCPRRSRAAVLGERAGADARRRAARCSSWTCCRRRPTAASICSRRRSRRPTGSTPTSPTRSTDRYPLSLISPASERTISSTLGELRPGIARLTIPPGRRAPRDRSPRATPCGCSTSWARSSAKRPSRPKFGRGRPRCPKACGRGARSTAPPPMRSCPIRLTDLAGGACFNDARVQVEMLGRH